jgi:hypothetical protein
MRRALDRNGHGPVHTQRASGAVVERRLVQRLGGEYFQLTMDHRNANIQNGNGIPLPTFSLTFYLTDTAGAGLSGNWGTDDAGVLALNGNTLDYRAVLHLPPCVLFFEQLAIRGRGERAHHDDDEQR